MVEHEVPTPDMVLVLRSTVNTAVLPESPLFHRHFEPFPRPETVHPRVAGLPRFLAKLRLAGPSLGNLKLPPAARRPPSASGKGSPVFFRHVLEHLDVQRLVSHELLQTFVLLFQFQVTLSPT
jgi:hypothetical protein